MSASAPLDVPLAPAPAPLCVGKWVLMIRSIRAHHKDDAVEAYGALHEVYWRVGDTPTRRLIILGEEGDVSFDDLCEREFNGKAKYLAVKKIKQVLIDRLLREVLLPEQERPVAKKVALTSYEPLLGLFPEKGSKEEAGWACQSWTQLQAWFQAPEQADLRATLLSVWARARAEAHAASYPTQAHFKAAREKESGGGGGQPARDNNNNNNNNVGRPSQPGGAPALSSSSLPQLATWASPPLPPLLSRPSATLAQRPSSGGCCCLSPPLSSPAPSPSPSSPAAVGKRPRPSSSSSSSNNESWPTGQALVAGSSSGAKRRRVEVVSQHPSDDNEIGDDEEQQREEEVENDRGKTNRPLDRPLLCETPRPGLSSSSPLRSESLEHDSGPLADAMTDSFFAAAAAAAADVSEAQTPEQEQTTMEVAWHINDGEQQQQQQQQQQRTHRPPGLLPPELAAGSSSLPPPPPPPPGRLPQSATWAHDNNDEQGHDDDSLGTPWNPDDYSDEFLCAQSEKTSMAARVALLRQATPGPVDALALLAGLARLAPPDNATADDRAVEEYAPGLGLGIRGPRCYRPAAEIIAARWGAIVSSLSGL